MCRMGGKPAGGLLVGASLAVMGQDTKRMRGERPFVFSNLKTEQGLADIIAFIERDGMLV